MAQTQETSEDKHVMAKILTLSDTHGMQLDDHIPTDTVDVCIHASDLTEESKLEEFKASLSLLRTNKSPLKLLIAGNHDFTLDTDTFRRKVHEAHPPLDPGLVKKFYGYYNEARLLCTNAANDGIHLLNEGTHEFSLGNGGKLRVYASPYTPSLGQGAFQYEPTQGHDFDIGTNADVVITHGPPRGILDRPASRDRAGSSQLFAAVAKAKPKLHCFGHLHEGWGAKLVAWRDTQRRT